MPEFVNIPVAETQRNAPQTVAARLADAEGNPPEDHCTASCRWRLMDSTSPAGKPRGGSTSQRANEALRAEGRVSRA